MLAIACILVILSIPMMTSSAQSGDDGQDFLVTLALMAVADDRMDGVLDTADLANLRDLVDLYYSDLPYNQMGEEEGKITRKQGDEIISQLDTKIKFQKDRSNQMVNIILLEKMMDQAYERVPNPFGGEPKSNPILDVIAEMGEYKAHPFYRYLLDIRLQQDYENTLKNQLDGHVATTVDGGDQLVSQSSDTTYDFSAGLSKEEYLDLLNQTKPLVFINNGSRDVTVSIEYYAPPKSVAISAPGLNLTVPKENKITDNGFPQGNYTFCAQWQTDLDTNGDGIKD